MKFGTLFGRAEGEAARPYRFAGAPGMDAS